MAVATPQNERPTDETTVDDEPEIQTVLDALQDDDCRAVLAAASEEALSARELSSACDLPLSTTYRKLDALTEAGLLAERTRLCPDGKHASEYLRAVDDVVVSTGTDGGFELTVSKRAVGDGVRGRGD
ncbi:helix-turn-helix domain-containing protein [Haloplanus salilacus]|uniref:helix-turn-helix domain-containing protein n=1 Tax=Haloplanus salilacus TaxID=2949994 RepID=UPI0030CED436